MDCYEILDHVVIEITKEEEHHKIGDDKEGWIFILNNHLYQRMNKNLYSLASREYLCLDYNTHETYVLKNGERTYIKGNKYLMDGEYSILFCYDEEIEKWKKHRCINCIDFDFQCYYCSTYSTTSFSKYDQYFTWIGAKSLDVANIHTGKEEYNFSNNFIPFMGTEPPEIYQDQKYTLIIVYGKESKQLRYSVLDQKNEVVGEHGDIIYDTNFLDDFDRLYINIPNGKLEMSFIEINGDYYQLEANKNHRILYPKRSYFSHDFKIIMNYQPTRFDFLEWTFYSPVNEMKGDYPVEFMEDLTL